MPGPAWYDGGRRRGAVRWRIARWRPPPAVWLMVLVALVFSAAAWTAVALDRSFRPALLAIAEAKARVAANQAIHRAISAEVLEGVRYEQLIRVVTDRQGDRVLLLQPDSVAINRIVDRANRAAEAALAALDGQPVSIPLGQVWGYGLLGGAGPRIRLRLHPIGAVQTSVRSEFRAAGINQTHHQVILEMKATLRLASPLVGGDVEAPFTTVLAEAIINGEVPPAYWRWGGP